MIYSKNTSLQRQRGIATLLITVMMLIVLGIMALYTNRSIIIEQKTTTNTYKHALALEAAQSGVEHFMGEMSAADKTVGTETNYKKYFDPPAGTSTEWTLKTTYDNKAKINNKGYLNATANVTSHDFLQSGLKLAKDFDLPLAKDAAGTDINGQAQSYQVFLYSIAPASAGDKTRFVLISQGCSDACTYSQAFVVTEFTIGETKVCPMDINGKFSGKNGVSLRAITDINNKPANKAAYNCGLNLGSPPTNTGTGDSSDVTGCDVGTCTEADRYKPNYNIQSDPNKDNHFKKYFQDTLANVKTKGSTCVLAGNVTATTLNDKIKAGGFCEGKTVVIEGNLTVDTALVTSKLTLVVEGDLIMSWGTTTFDGFLYVKGNTNSTVAGSMNINGAAAFAGDVTGELSWAIYADATKAKLPGLGGLTANFRSGSWRDF